MSPPGLALSTVGAKELAAEHPRLATQTFPIPAPGSTVLLPSSNRRLGYCELLDPNTPPESLRTVVLIPGSPGCRLFTHPDVAKRGFVPSWRLIILERPGLGLSDPAPDTYSYTDFAADFREFCAQLGLSRVSVIGFSAGTPFATALACTPSAPPKAPQPPSNDTKEPAGGVEAAAAAAAEKAEAEDPSKPGTEDAAAAAPQAATEAAETAAAEAGTTAGGEAPQGSGRAVEGVVVERVALVSAIGPPDSPNKRQGMALLFQIAYWASASLPWLVRWLVRSEANGMRRRPVHGIREAFAPYGKIDVDVLKRPEIEAMFLESALELYSRGQEEAVAREAIAFAGRPWGLDLGACAAGPTRVAVWQGALDRGCTPAMASCLVERLNGGSGGVGGGEDGGEGRARLRLVEGAGHMLYFDVWGDVVAWVDGADSLEGGGRGGAGADGGAPGAGVEAGAGPAVA
ncbi:hypothetical protein HYH03_007075 [Edaphochlamys debaryana]|uniref:AB hydrolase-1 domain-containing protein n=1 Tax=Edaphochlamys debaryana TaxID=47281 RepID=A0A835Y2N6_9CHLO|nr:hypothetical protein HYH03_007075 [Edaphochlamys debaryana]|eukprot:KAG2494835.1 hypothetical protein HYH03_007075 [Edaphochlamys debaryana]